jgi:hypothetical protein
MTELKQLRIDNNATQAYCAKILQISLRSYKDYENDESKSNTAKYNYLLGLLKNHFEINENKGILAKNFIIKTCSEIFKDYSIDYCYLFGSYAKGTAKETSDVDLLISSTCTGFKFYELLEKLKEQLHKNIDLLDTNQLKNNPELLNEILMTGERFYGKC